MIGNARVKKVSMVVSFGKIPRITAQRTIKYYSNILMADVKFICKGSGKENLCCAFKSNTVTSKAGLGIRTSHFQARL